MFPNHNRLSVLATLNIFMIAGVLAGMPDSAHAQEQIEQCTGSNFPLGKSFLEIYGIKTDTFENAPADIQCFVEIAATCQHFAGEYPYDAERRKEIVTGLKATCPVAQTMLRTLEIKYENNHDIKPILAVCEKGSKAVCAWFDSSQLIE